jgi:cell division protein FtsQ
VLFTSPRFKVEQIAVRRQSASAEAAITRATQLSQVVGHNVFLVNTARVAQEVAAVPSVRSARVVPRFPNHVEIEIVERVPIAVWRTAAGAFFVDDQGYVVAEAGDEVPATLPALKDTTGRELHPGDQISQRVLLAAIEVATALPKAGAGVREIEVAPQGVVFTTDAGWRVIVGDAESLNQKLANFAAFVELAKSQSLKVQTLDLRPLDRPFYQVESSPAAPTQTARPAAGNSPSR